MVDHVVGGAVCLLIQELMSSYLMILFISAQLYASLSVSSRKRKHHAVDISYSLIHRMPAQIKHLNRVVNISDIDCISNLRMDRSCFHRLCELLRDLGGLIDGNYVTVEEQVASFLGILAHHKKKRIVGFDYNRSGQTISHYVHRVLKAILKLHNILLIKPQPVTDDCTDPRWRCFKGCLGALDGSYINVKVSNIDKPRYRTRKGQISTNVLAVCDRNLRFVYVLPGWEGSAGDSRVLRDAVSRPNGFKVPHGQYYLCDNGYANMDGFLTPYKSVRYHLKEWGPNTVLPQNPKEIFNMRHTKARNVIERAFGIMKMRWSILRSASYYPTKTQNRLIMACFLLHNFIRTQMEVDPIEQSMEDGETEGDNVEEEAEVNNIDLSLPTNEWNRKRDEIAEAMWEDYSSTRI